MEDVLTVTTQRQQTRLNAERTAAKYAAALVDVMMNRNLQQHLDDVAKSIAVVDSAIARYFTEEPVAQPVLDFKNKLYFLKWLILERM